MLNFPVPYPEELVYSTIARAGIHWGIVDAKELLDEVFHDRKILATFDLPNHLDVIIDQYPASLNISPECLAYNHTLFPLYAPFVTEQRRKRCLKWMSGKNRSAVHLSLGVAASLIKPQKKFRYCPKCLELQLKNYGECYWHRQWQIIGADCCLLHGQLIESDIKAHNYHRHAFAELSPHYMQSLPQRVASVDVLKMTKRIQELLLLPPREACPLWQWTLFYQQLAAEQGCLRGRGKQVNYENLKGVMKAHWSPLWLNNHGLMISDAQSSWLHSIFRKHRKAFNYLQHLAVIDAFIDSSTSLTDVIETVACINKPKTTVKRGITNTHQECDAVISQEKRDHWLTLIGELGPKQSRKSDAALYAWLYRHDKSWLLEMNLKYSVKKATINNRVDWDKRDRKTVRQLIHIKDGIIVDITSNRHSKNWYLQQLNNTDTVSKNLTKLPLTDKFLQKYDESIEDYQLHRVMHVIDRLTHDDLPIKRWRIMRMAGLSEERLRQPAKNYLYNLGT